MDEYGLRFETSHSSAMDFGSYGLGTSVNPMQDQLQGTNLAINWGVQHAELGFMGNRWEGQGAPIGKFGKPEREEVIRLAKMNKVALTVHAPIKDAAGFNRGVFDEASRQQNLYDFNQTLEFADQIGKSAGVKHVPMVLHCADGTPGNPDPTRSLVIVDRDTLEAKQLTYLENERFSRKLLYQLDFPMDKLSDKRFAIPRGGDNYTLTPEGKMLFQNARALQDMRSSIANADYSIAIYKSQYQAAEAESKPQEILKSWEDNLATAERQKMMLEEKFEHMKEQFGRDPQKYKQFVPIDVVAKEKVAETISDLAVRSAKMPSQPLIAVENIYPEMALGKPEELAKTVELARRKFLEKARKAGISASPALAENIIGMTLDTGHLNIWKKYKDPDTGEHYTDADIQKWAEKAYPVVKHLHIADNFGDEDTHLPIGWGNAPVKEIAEMFKKKGYKGKYVAEVPGAPGGPSVGLRESFQYLNLPLTPVATWEKAANAYFQSGSPFMVGPIYPDISTREYGIGFSGLPYSTGGQFGGGAPGAPGQERSEFAGAPMA